MKVCTKSELDELLSHMDLERPGLENVRSAEDLRSYFRNRTSVRHPADNNGAPVTTEQMEIADGALRNVLLAMHAYPRHDFGKDIDWLTNAEPSGDNEWLWGLHRQPSWDALAAAYRHTDEERYAECYARQLLDWIDKVPLDEETALRGESPGWRTLEAGIRAHSWTYHFRTFLRSYAYTPEVLVKHLLSFHLHADFLYRTLNLENVRNWGLMRAEGLAFVGITFPEFRDAEKWRRKAFVHLNAQIHRQVRPDGHQLEQCLNYHTGAISWFRRTAELAEMNELGDEFPPEYMKRLEKMCEVLMKLGLPNGSSAQFSDTSSPIPCRRALKRWAEFFDRDDFRHFATSGAEGTPPAETAYALTDSGFYSMRSGWDEDAICMVLQCGPDVGGHCHQINGTFEICAFGRRLTPDSGTYVYSGDEEAHQWFKRSRVDQTMTLDGEDIAHEPRLLLWQPGEDLDALVVENVSYPGLTHRRAVLFVRKSFFVIVDEALGDAAGDLRAHFRLAAGPSVIDEGALCARTDSADEANILVQGMPADGIAMVQEDGWVSFRYGVREPRPAFCFRTDKGKESIRFVTLMVPCRDNEPPEARVSIVGDPGPGAARLEINVTVNGEQQRVGYSL